MSARPRMKASATGTTTAPGWSSSQICAASGEAKKCTWSQNADRTDDASLGTTIDTTALAGSTAVTPSVGSTETRTRAPVAWHGDSIRAARPRNSGRISVSNAHHVYSWRPLISIRCPVSRRSQSVADDAALGVVLGVSTHCGESGGDIVDRPPSHRRERFDLDRCAGGEQLDQRPEQPGRSRRTAHCLHRIVEARRETRHVGAHGCGRSFVGQLRVSVLGSRPVIQAVTVGGRSRSNRRCVPRDRRRWPTPPREALAAGGREPGRTRGGHACGR